MPEPPATDVRLLFGGTGRTRILGLLAGLGYPVTAYRVARDLGLERTQTYLELRRLLALGVVGSERTSTGRPGWVLKDGSIRSFCRRRVRIRTADDLFLERDRRIGSVRRRLSTLPKVDLTRYVPRPDRVPSRSEFSRSERKDATLRAMRLQESRRNMSRRAGKGARQ